MITRSEARRAQRELSNANTNLLRLPAELRNQIYTYVLPNWSEYRVGSSNQNDILRPSILSTSRQIRKEAASIFYGRAHFVFLPTGPIVYYGRAWLRALPTDVFALIRRFSSDTFVKFDYKAGAMNEVGVMAHHVKVTIERHNTRFACSCECNGSCRKGESICPVMQTMFERAAELWGRLKTTCEENKGFQKEDVLEVTDMLHEYARGMKTS